MTQYLQDHYLEDQERPARRRRHPVRTFFTVLLVFLLLVALAAGGYLWSLARSFNNGTTTIENALPADSPAKDPAAGSSQNILLIGTDARDPGSEASRSDTMMLVHLPGDRSTAYVMSIMRDTWTEIPGYGEGKINSAMALGGVPLAVGAVQAMLDAPVDHVAIVDFEGFSGLTDALGGVDVNNPVAFSSSIADDSFPSGRITLDGGSALNYVRERKAFPEGDYQRVLNQQTYVNGLVSSVLSAETLLNPFKVSSAVSEIAPYLSVDEDLDAAAAGRLAFSLRSVRANNLTMFTLPTLGPGTSSDGQSIVVKDETAIAEIAEALDNDNMAGYPAANNGGL